MTEGAVIYWAMRQLRLEPPSRDDSALLKKVKAIIMERIAAPPERIRSYFKHPADAHAAG